MHQGDYSILAKFAARRYNQFGAGVSVMTIVMDASSGTSKARAAKINEEAENHLKKATPRAAQRSDLHVCPPSR